MGLLAIGLLAMKAAGVLTTSDDGSPPDGARWDQWDLRNERSKGAAERAEAFRQSIESRSGLAERLNLPLLEGKGLKGKEGNGKRGRVR